ncbi:hypothetical protein RJ639_019845 [Escallonia herrerae]|uniref:Nucleotide exchange factor Fes1 domain-containing protein n=1 Tax=Escallonia herrerae TaxID=1293975 RepID=A0AA89AH87_9ASTE|nr:hypothetical protein RJ639_019845 [Escallonia herrerae]
MYLQMERWRLVILAWVVLAIGISAMAERVNKSASGGLFWSTAKEEGDLVRKAEADESAAAVLNDEDDFHGGFSTLDGMLQWAIGHSDPVKIQETAQDVQRLSSDELKKRHAEMKELMEKLKRPSVAQLMQIALDELRNSSLPMEDRRRALQDLLVLVEPIDNAIDLHKLGGLAVVMGELNNLDAEIRTTSAWILEEAIKALYAVSALIRNNLDGQQLFHAGAGEVMLQKILRNSSIDSRLRRKAVFLVADLVECQIEIRNEADLQFFSTPSFLNSVVDLIASTDLDLQEKALFIIKNLIQLGSTKALVLKDFCGLDGALERMRLQLQQLMVEEEQAEYAIDVESLRREVEVLFIGKLTKCN